MKKTIAIFILLCMSHLHAFCQSPIYPGTIIPLQVFIVHPTVGGAPTPKSPMQPPTVYLDDHTLYIDNPNGYTIEIVDEEDDTVVYTNVIPAEVTTWQLPSTLSGTYIIRLISGNWMFVGEISL